MCVSLLPRWYEGEAEVGLRVSRFRRPNNASPAVRKGTWRWKPALPGRKKTWSRWATCGNFVNRILGICPKKALGISVSESWRRLEKTAQIKRLRRIVAKTSMHICLPSSYSNNLAHKFSVTLSSARKYWLTSLFWSWTLQYQHRLGVVWEASRNQGANENIAAPPPALPKSKEHFPLTLMMSIKNITQPPTLAKNHKFKKSL